MNPVGRSGIQSHLTLTFPMKTPADAQALAQKLPSLMPDVLKAAEAIGTVHYSRFIVLSERTVLFLADFDGELEKLLRGLAQQIGPVLDAIYEHVENPPLSPVATNVETFIQWATAHNAQPAGIYTAYPKGSVQDIKSRARAAGITGNSEQIPFLVIMPLKSGVAAFTLEQVVFRVAGKMLTDGSDTIGTLHFAHFVPLEDNKLGFFTVYDGPFDKYIQDFADKLGPIFDLLFKFVIDPPPTPVAKNATALTAWLAARDLPPIGLYSAYPGLTVLDVNALLADG
jgi:hypothetical protein